MSSVSDYNAYATANQRLQDSYESERTAMKQNHEESLQKTKEDYEKSILNMKEDYRERLHQERESANEDVRKLKEELYDARGKKSARENMDMYGERYDFDRYHDEVTKHAEERIDSHQRRANEQIDRARKNNEAEMHKALGDQKKTAEGELRNLSQELNSYRRQGIDLAHDRAIAKDAVLKEYELDHHHEQNRLREAYEAAIVDTKNHETEAARDHALKLEERMEEARVKNEQELRQQRDEFKEIQKGDRAELIRTDLEAKDRSKAQEARFTRGTQTLIQNNEAARNATIAEKDRVYQNYIGEKEQWVKQALDEKEAKIHELKTTQDPMKVSPALWEKMRAEAEMKNYQVLTEAEKSYRRNLDAEKARDDTERKDFKQGYNEKLTAATRSGQRDRDVYNRQFYTAYQSLQEKNTNDHDRMRDEQHATVERLAAEHANQTDLQQKRFTEQLENQKDTLLTAKANTMDDFENKQRLTEREWSMRYSDLRRDFEKKMTEQQDNHEQTIAQVKFENDKRLRDQDRKFNHLLEDRVKAYEYQIKQQEVAFKERERFLTEHYEEELDKVKRSNARLIQKKS